MGLVGGSRATGRRRQAGNLERKGDLEIEHRSCRSIDTPRLARAALERCALGQGWSRRSPRGQGRQRESEGDKRDGTRAFTWANPLGCAADPGLEQGPEVDATWLGVVGQPATETRRQRREDMATDEVVQLGRGRNPGAESWTWQQGEIDLQGTARSKPSRACETLRTELR
jgi:hypothetical protein